MSLWWLGALIYVLGSIIINFGSNLIRFDHERQARKKEAWEKKRDLGNKVPNNDEAVEVSGNPKDIEMDVVVDPAPSPRAENHELEVDVDVDVEQGPSPAFVKPPFPRLGKLASPSLARSSSGLLRNQDSEDPVKIDLPSGNQMSSKKGLEKGVSPSSSPAVSDVTVEETATTTTTTTTTTKTSSTTKVEQYNMPSVLGRPLWVFGFSIFVVGNILNWVAFMFTAQSLCAALGSVQFVSNLIFANLINKEKITLRAILSTVLIVTGNIVIVIFGSKSSANWDAEQLIEGLKNHTFIAYLMFATALVILMQATYWGCLAHLKRPPHPDDPSFTMSFRRAFPNSLAKRLVPFTYAAVSAIIGVNSVLLGKMSAGLIMAGIVEGIDQGPIVGLKSIFHISTFVIIILFLGIIAFWIYRMNTALKRYSAIFIIPVLQVIWLVFGVLEGGIFFDEFSALSPLSQFFFALGIFILLVGLIILSPRPPTASAAAPIETEQEIIDLEAELGPIEVPGLQKQEQVNVEVEPEFYEERNFDRPSPSKVHPPSSSTSSSSSSSSYPKDQHSRSQNQVGSYDGYMEHDLSVDLDLDPIPRGRTFSTSPYTTSFHDGPSPPHSPPHHQSSSSSHLPSHQYEYQDQDAPVSEDHYNDRDHPLSDDQSYNPHLYGNERGDGNLHYDDAPHFQPPPTNEWNDQGHEVQFHDVDEDATTSHPFFDTSRFENAREAVVSERSPPHPSGQEQEHEPSIPVHDEFYGGNPTHNDSSYFDSNPERVDLDSLSSDWPSEPSFPTFPSSSSSQLPSESFDHSYSPAPLPSSYALAFEPSQEDQLGAIPLGNASNDPNEDHVDFEDDLSTPGLNTWETSADLPNFSDFSTLDLQTPEDDDEGW